MRGSGLVYGEGHEGETESSKRVSLESPSCPLWGQSEKRQNWGLGGGKETVDGRVGQTLPRAALKDTKGIEESLKILQGHGMPSRQQGGEGSQEGHGESPGEGPLGWEA